MRGAFISVADLVAIAIILDMASQYLIFRRVNPAAALLVGPILIAGPYSFSRTLANRNSDGRWGGFATPTN